MLFQVAFHAEIAKRYSEFDMSDVTTAICEKMIKRHSHIFGHDHASNSGEVATLWEKNKMRERGQTRYSESLREVSKSFPAMMRAAKVLKRLDGACDCAETVESARKSAEKAILDGTDVGDALLKCVSLARAMGEDPEIALQRGDGSADSAVRDARKRQECGRIIRRNVARVLEFGKIVRYSRKIAGIDASSA